VFEGNQFWEDAVEELEFACGPEDVVVCDEVLVVVEEHEGVVAAFAELHHEVYYGAVADFGVGCVEV
jgi:hypothetical protein